MEESVNMARLAGFRLLSEERKSEILGMAEALTYAQKGEIADFPVLAGADRIKQAQEVLGSVV